MKKILLIIIGILAGIGIAGYIAYNAGAGKVLTTKAETVKLKFEDLGEFATQVAYTTEVKSIPKEDISFFNLFSIPFTGSNKIFSYPVNIKAGLNFNEIKPEVNEFTKTINIKMPEIKVLSCEVDYNGFKLYDEHESIFTNISLKEENDAIADLKNTAIENSKNNGLFDRAKENAEVMLKGFFGHAFDLDEYEIKFIY